jgi:hypothetical protein
MKPKAKLSNALLRMVPVRAAQGRATKKTIVHFADSLGLVYFGYVDQHADEHELVRGFTLSMEHRDNHYCVGSINGYDVTLVERTDIIRFPDKPSQRYSWLILQIDLRGQDFPHAFFSSVRHPDTYYANFFIKQARFRKLGLDLWVDHDPAFVQHFSAFGAFDDSRDIRRLFSVDITAAMARYFSGLEFELTNDKLYVYASNQHITYALLERIVKNGLWLARQLDTVEETQDDARTFQIK